MSLRKQFKKEIFICDFNDTPKPYTYLTIENRPATPGIYVSVYSKSNSAVSSILLHGCTTWALTKRIEKKLDSNYTRMPWVILNHPGDSTPQSSSGTATNHPSWKLSKLDEPDMQDTAREVWMSS